MSLVGGETAQLSGLYQPGEYDLAGFAVGIVERARIPEPSSVRAGDVLIGIASSGLHSNGFSLVRRVLKHAKLKLGAHIDELGCTLGEELLRPTLIYAKVVGELFDRFKINGLANITGGGVLENLPRVMPDEHPRGRRARQLADAANLRFDCSASAKSLAPKWIARSTTASGWSRSCPRARPIASSRICAAANMRPMSSAKSRAASAECRFAERRKLRWRKIRRSNSAS